jgi:hypothetical protein
MQHLNPERISALADEAASADERAHISACAECAAELGAAQRLVRLALTETPAIEQPLTSWDRLGPALREAGLAGDRDATQLASRGISMGARTRGTVVRGMRVQWAQVAAAVLFAVGGAVVGRASATYPTSAPAQTASADTFTTRDDALAALERASNDYQRAVAYLAVHDPSAPSSAGDAAMRYQARLDALDQAVAATRAALYRAPEDPVLNNYYLAGIGARDFTLQQMGQVVPVNVQRKSF